MKISLKQYPDVYGLRGYEAKKKVVLVPKVREVIVQPKIASTATPTPKRITEGVDCTTPLNYPENYVECVAFVEMAYNMAGKPLKGKIAGAGARDWAFPSNNKAFDIHESGKSTQLPEVGDALVWISQKYSEYGHIGVITAIKMD